MTDSTAEAETVKVRFTGTTEGRNATGVIRLAGRDDVVLGAADDGDVGEVSLEELDRLQQAGLVLEVLDGGSDETQDRAPEPDEVVVPPADTTPAPAPVAGRRGRNTSETTTEDGATS